MRRYILRRQPRAPPDPPRPPAARPCGRPPFAMALSPAPGLVLGPARELVFGLAFVSVRALGSARGLVPVLFSPALLVPVQAAQSQPRAPAFLWTSAWPPFRPLVPW